MGEVKEIFLLSVITSITKQLNSEQITFFIYFIFPESPTRAEKQVSFVFILFYLYLIFFWLFVG